MSSTTEILTSLTDRVAHLEGQNKRTRAAAWLLGTALLLVVSLGAVQKQSGDDVIKAKSFQIVDDDGNVRGSFEVMQYGNARLSLHDAANLAGVYLDANSSSASGPGLKMYGEQGSIRASLWHLMETQDGYQLEHHGPCIDLYDESGNMRVTLGYSKYTGSWLDWLNESGETVYSIPVD